MKIVKAILVRGFGAVLVLVLNFFASLILAAPDFTIFVYAFSLSTLLGIFICHGGSQYIVKTAAVQKSNDGLMHYWYFFCRRSFGFWILGNLSLVFLYYFGFMPSEVSVDIIFIASLSSIFFAFVQVYSYLMQGFGFINKSILYQSVLIPSLSIVLVAIVSLFSNITATVLMLCYCCAAFFVFLLISRRVSFVGKNQFISFDNLGAKLYYPYMAISWLTLLLQNFAQFYSAKALSVDAFAYVNVVSRLSLIIGFALIIFNSVYSRTIARLFFDKDIIGVRKVLVRSTVILSFMSFLFYLAVELYGHLYLVSFGVERYAPIEVMKLIVLGQCINVAFGPALSVLAMAGREKTYMYITTFSVGFSLVLTPIFINQYGVIGAGYSALLSVGSPALLAVLALILHSLKNSRTD